uniref:Cytochrome p450 n=1 Tax=Epiphyas postvittana TaxID=65032 RepID=A0A0K8TUI0_EPIPO
MFLLYFVLCCVCAVFVRFKWRAKNQRLLELAALTPTLKGGFPVLGNALVFHGDSVHLWKAFQRVMKETNAAGGVLAIWLGPSLHYMITDPEDAVMVMNNCLEKNRYIYDMGNVFLGSSLINADVSRWKRNRKLFNPSFSQHMLNRFQFVFNLQARNLVRSLEPLAGQGATTVWTQVADVAITTVCMTVLGISKANESLVSENYKAAVASIFAVFSERISKVILHPEMLFNMSPLKKTQDHLMKTIRSQSAQVVTQRKKERAAEKDDTKTRSSVGHRFESFLDILLDLVDDNLFEEHEVQDEMNSVISAGYDTLSTSIPYTLMLIGSHPEVQKKLYEEIITVVGPDEEITNHHNLPYLDAVFKESLRLYPPVPIISRDCDEEIQLKNYKLPAGCHCTIGLWAIQRLPIWGPDAEQFRPERWLNPGSLPTNLSAYCAFSIGKRNCLGKFYSVLFTKTVLSYVVRRFHISADINELKFKFEILLKPTGADRVTLELR